MSSKVLVVDVEQGLLNWISDILEPEGYAVDSASDTEAAKQFFVGKTYDLVLMDSALTDESGSEFAREVKRIAPDIQVIVMSGSPTVEIASEALRAGVNDLLLKPLERDSLLKAVHEAVRSKQRKDEKRALDEQNQRYQRNLEELVDERNSRLEESEARFRDLVERLHEGIWSLDERGQTLFVNPRMAELLNEARGGMLRAPIDEFLDEAGRALFRRKLEEWGEGGREGMDLELLRKDGGRVYTHFEITPIFDGAGRFRGLTAAVSDLTARRQAEREKLYLAAALEQVAETILITGIDGVIEYVNPAFERLTGYTREEAIGKTPAIVRSGKHDAAFYAKLWATILNGETWYGRFVNMRKNGTLYEEEASITPVLDETGKVCRFIAVKRDVTEKMNVERRFQQAQKMEAIGALAGGIAHDFNNLLAAIMGYGEIAISELPPDSPHKQDLEQILAAGERAKQLVRQILLFCRQAEAEPQPVEVHLIVGETLKLLRPTLPATIAIRSHIDKNAGMVLAEPTQIHQVLMNLCTNAYHALRDTGGTLEVGVRPYNIEFEDDQSRLGLPEGNYVHLWVSDDGPGIPAALQERIFEPFFTTKGPE